MVEHRASSDGGFDFLFSLALDAYPAVTVQVAMIGGAMPFIAEQIEFAEQSSGAPTALQRLHRVYVDTGANGRGPRAVALAARVFGIDRMAVPTFIWLVAANSAFAVD